MFGILLGSSFLVTALFLLRDGSSPLWFFGIAISAGLSISILLLSFQESLALQRQHELELLENRKQIASLERSLVQTQEALEQQSRVALERLDLLNEARLDKFQLKLLKEAAEKQAETVAEVTAAEVMYKQLRKQFSEKSEVLNQTRVELFQVENSLLALQKECELHAHDSNPHEIALADELKSVEQERDWLEAEVHALQDLISTLLKSPSRKKSSAPVLRNDSV